MAGERLETRWQIEVAPTLCILATHSYICFLCYITGSFINGHSNITVGDFTFSDSAYSFQVCGAVCRIQLYKALQTPIDTLHSPVKIVRKSFSITVYTTTWSDESLAFMARTKCYSTVNWMWENNMEDSFKAQYECQNACTTSVQVIVIVTQLCSRAHTSRHLCVCVCVCVCVCQ